MATLVNYTCKSFTKWTPDTKFMQEEKGPPFTKKETTNVWINLTKNAGLNINSRQNSIYSSDKKYNVSLLLVIFFFGFFGFSPFLCFYWLFSSSTVKYTKLFHTNCPRCFSLFHEKTLREKLFNVNEATRFQSKDAVSCKGIYMKGRNFGAKLKHLISGRIIFFIARSTDWLAKTHLRQERLLFPY